MIQFTIFNPLSGMPLSFNSCSHEEEVWNQPQVGQGFVLGWRDNGWLSAGDEGFVRDADGFLRTQDWLDRHWPAP
jgi:hypothetical protein